MSTAPAADPTIQSDLACAICGYNLKGLSPDANCPECGQPIARSYTPDLHRSDPKWLRYQANTMLLLATLCIVSFRPFPVYGVWELWVVLGIAATAPSAWACWRLATPEPPGPPGDWEATLQRSLRIAPLIYTGITTLSLIHRAFGQVFWSVATFANIASLIVTAALAGWFLLRLARRSNDRGLVLHAQVVAWAFPISQGSVLLSNYLSYLFRDSVEPKWFSSFHGALNWLLGAAVYAAALLMGRLHEVLRAAARAAESKTSYETVER